MLKIISVTPLTFAALISSDKFSQLHCLGRPVVAPYSSPIFCNLDRLGWLPANFFAPTYVTYGFATPMILLMFWGGIPAFIAAETVHVLELTYGKEEKMPLLDQAEIFQILLMQIQ